MARSSRSRLYLVFGAFLVTYAIYYRFIRPKLLPYISMREISGGLSPIHGSGMGPYSLMDDLPLHDTYLNPTKKRVAVVMTVPNDDPISDASFLNHQRYCQIHGYRFMTPSRQLLLEEPSPQPKGHEFQKIAAIMQALLIGLDRNEFDWILWADLNSFITDPSVPLEAFLPPSNRPDAYFLASQEGFNAGAAFIKVDQWSVGLLAVLMAEPLILHKQGAVDPVGQTSARSSPSSLGSVFEMFPTFGKHFQEIPSEWLSGPHPNDLEWNSTDATHLLPPIVEEWAQNMTTALSAKGRHGTTDSAKPPPPLDGQTLDQLGHHRLSTTLLSASFQVHLVDHATSEFDSHSLVAINSQMMQVATAALVLQYHKHLGTVKLDALTLWETEIQTSLVGLKYIEQPGLLERRDEWYRYRKSGIEGMTWSDVRR